MMLDNVSSLVALILSVTMSLLAIAWFLACLNTSLLHKGVVILCDCFFKNDITNVLSIHCFNYIKSHVICIESNFLGWGSNLIIT